MLIYIPTTSINADSILSCECVAPAAVCRIRNFGYQNFESLPELRHFENVTLAFSKVPVFYINDQLRENYPMVVEIEIKEDDINNAGFVKLKSVEGVDIYATANPILITPTNARLLFFKTEHLDYTYHNCSDSAKCKLLDFFSRCFSDVRREVIGSSIASYVKDLQVPNLQLEYSENDYNRVKGFIWGFGLGAFVSMAPEIAGLLKIQKRIYDIISSTKNDGYIPQNLKAELESLDKEYSTLDPFHAEAKTLWNDYLTKVCDSFNIKAEDVPSAINKLLVSLKVENEAKVKFLAENNIQLRKPLSSYSTVGGFGYEQYCTDLERHTQAVIYRNRQDCLNSHTFDSLDVDTDKFETVVLSGNDRESTLFNRFLFKVIWSNLIPSLEDLRVNRSESAKQVVIALKSIIEGIGETWAESPIQAYFDRMRKNISKYEPFNPKDEQSAVLQSISSFVLKGEDFDSLKSYIETNAISDYRYAFALWGAMTGYVSITRTVIEHILKTNSNMAKLYNLTEMVLDKVNPKLIYPSAPVSPGQPIVTSNGNNINTDEESPTNKAITFRNKVLQYFHKVVKKNKRNKETLEEGLLLALDKFGDDSDSFRFVCILNDFSKYGWKDSLTPWKQMCEYICPEYNQHTSRSNSNSSEVSQKPKSKSILGRIGDALFGFDNSDEISYSNNSEPPRPTITSLTSKMSFANNNENVNSILFAEGILSEGVLLTVISQKFPAITNKIAVDINWFVGNYQEFYTDKKGQTYRGKYFNLPKDILSVISNLERYLNGKVISDQEWLREKYKDIPVQYIIEYLYSLYGSR